MHQFVSLLVERLEMDAGELVMAYTVVQRALMYHPTMLRASSIRPMLLGACIITCKTSRDADLNLRQVPSPPRQPTRAPLMLSTLHGRGIF